MLHAWRHEYAVNNSIPPKQDVFPATFGPLRKSLAKHGVWHTYGGPVSSMICAWRREYTVNSSMSPKHARFPEKLVTGAGGNAIKPSIFALDKPFSAKNTIELGKKTSKKQIDPILPMYRGGFRGTR